MKLSEVIERLGLEALTDAPTGAEVTGGYASDLLSFVMAKAKPGSLWITVQGHTNIVAVTSLVNLAGVVVAGGSPINPDTVAKAQEEQIVLLASDRSTYELAGQLYALGIPG